MQDRKETSIFIKIAVFAAAVFAVVIMVRLQVKYNDYKIQKEQLQAEVDELHDKADELREIAESDSDRDYIVEIAKEKLNLRLPEEVIFYNDLFG